MYLGLVKYLILGIKLGEVVEDFDGRFGNGGEDLTNLGIGFGCVVRCGGTDGAQDGSSDGKAENSSQETGGELDSFFVYGNNGGGLYGGSRRGFWGSWCGIFGHEDGGAAGCGTVEGGGCKGGCGSNHEGGDEESSVFNHGSAVCRSDNEWMM